MLNARLLKAEFVKALAASWDDRAIWPGCRDGYRPGISHPSYGQCLVGTLLAWQAHGGAEQGFDIVPGILKGRNMPPEGVWHFQLRKITADGTALPVDVSWDQVVEGSFTSAEDSVLFHRIVEASLIEDKTLVSRLAIIQNNLCSHDLSPAFRLDVPAQDIICAAYENLNLAF
ncbi:MAG: hypothetical protein LRY54_00185 [Alphaproteobacteria bacterium]|nr:hypothetical protein [Alphaproteobacteria bacterium]